MTQVWINGTFEPEDAAGVSLRDTGLLHAAGVFTTMRAADGRVFRLSEHLKRLRTSCEQLFIPLQFNDDVLSAATQELLSRNELTNARLRLTVTRGAATHDPVHGVRLNPNVFITAAPFEAYPADFYKRGMTVVLLDDQKLNPYDLQAGHKTLNYFSRLAGLRTATRSGAGEALWFDVHNFLQSGSISNVFIVKNKRLITPPTPDDMKDPFINRRTPYPKSSVLPGITRAAVIELAKRESIDVDTNAIDVSALLDADEVFLTNSIMGVMPVCRVEKKPIGEEEPGRMTLKLAEMLGREMA